MALARLQWGLASAVPPDATGAWGCRAIVTQDGHVDLVPNRTGQQGTTLIYHLLDTQFPITALSEALGRLLRSGQMITRRREQFELHTSATLTVAADTLSCCRQSAQGVSSLRLHAPAPSPAPRAHVPSSPARRQI